jgi:hypothetical protein
MVTSRNACQPPSGQSPSVVIIRQLELAGFAGQEVIEREPYSPDAEYQSRRPYGFARKSGEVR